MHTQLYEHEFLMFENAMTTFFKSSSAVWYGAVHGLCDHVKGVWLGQALQLITVMLTKLAKKLTKTLKFYLNWAKLSLIF